MVSAGIGQLELAAINGCSLGLQCNGKRLGVVLTHETGLHVRVVECCIRPSLYIQKRCTHGLQT